MKKIESDLIYGKNPVIEALQNEKVTIEKVLVQANLRGELEKEVRQLCKTKEVPISKVPLEKLNYICHKGNHQGVAAYISPISFQELEDVISFTFDQGKNPCIVILEGVTDVRNVGAIARSAYVMGVDALVFPMKHAARINEESVKISAGAILKLPVCRVSNMETAVNICKNFGLKIYATHINNASSLEQSDLTIPCALIMGSEGEGITLETERMADQLIKIPQATSFDSLNVSVAAGILFYEMHRQKIKV